MSTYHVPSLTSLSLWEPSQAGVMIQERHLAGAPLRDLQGQIQTWVLMTSEHWPFPLGPSGGLRPAPLPDSLASPRGGQQ